jgi:MFS superfamily sulfate permease-like transporter
VQVPDKHRNINESEDPMQAGDKPQNGIAGLRHWRYDLGAGLQVALVSLPLSLGIAVASGAPPVTGVISAIIAGLIFPFLGGAYVTISGPAAGLAPALLTGMLMLGNGDLAAGYPLLLVAICITGFVQIILSLVNAGRFAIFLPVTVVEAMLAAIGIMIIVKQIPPLLGDLAPLSKDMLTAILKLPESLVRIEAEVHALGHPEIARKPDPYRGAGGDHRCYLPVPDVLSEHYPHRLAAAGARGPGGGHRRHHSGIRLQPGAPLSYKYAR